MRYLKQPNSERRKEEHWLPGAGGERNGELLFSGSSVSVWDDKKVMEMDGGFDYTAVYLMPLNCVFKKG